MPAEPGAETGMVSLNEGADGKPAMPNMPAADVDRVEAFVGMVSEPHLPGSDMGAL